MVHIGDSSHCHKRQVVQEPANYRVDTGVMDLIDIGRFQLIIPALPTDQIPEHHYCKDSERCRRTPVDQGVAKKEILHNRIVPTTHTEANMEDGPLPEMRGKVILLVGIWNKGIVRGRHGYVEMNEVLQKG